MPKMLASYEMVQERIKTLAPRDFLNLRTLGFALARAWVYLMFLGTASSAITWDGSQVPGFVFVLSTICLATTLFICSIRHRQFLLLMERPLVRFLGPILMAAGTLLLVLSVLSDSLVIPFGIGGAFLTGIGSAGINLGWGEAYKQIDPFKTLFEAPFAFFIAAILFPIITSQPPEVACLVCAALPLLSGLILFGKLEVWKRPPLVEPAQFKLRPFAWKIGAIACLLGLADGVTRITFLGANPIGIYEFYQYPLVWASLLSMLVIYICALITRKLNYGFIYRPVILIMAFFYMLLPVINRSTLLANIVALVGYGTLNLLIWIILAEATRSFRLPSILVFGMGWGMVTLGVFFGSLVGGIIETFAPFSPQVLSLIALLATTAVFISYMFVLNENDLVELSQVIEDEEIEDKRSRPFQERCREIAVEYELSARETEIMILFAKGRSMPRIQEDLFISRGTATTHLRHIYQKINIHDKQELLDIIEGRDLR